LNGKPESNNNSIHDEKSKAIKFLDTGSIYSISSNLEKISALEGDYYVVKSNIPKKANI
jgi:hypothetical protein